MSVGVCASSRCGHVVKPEEGVRLDNTLYHSQCLLCRRCRRELANAERAYLAEGSRYCGDCFDDFRRMTPSVRGVELHIERVKPIRKERPNYELSGKPLSAFYRPQTGGLGVAPSRSTIKTKEEEQKKGADPRLKFGEPDDAALPTSKWRMYVYKDGEEVDCLHLHRRSCFLIGRDEELADIIALHKSVSGQHAVIQFRRIWRVSEGSKDDPERLTKTASVFPYIMDIKSTNGTFLNGTRIAPSRYIELKDKDVLKLGESTREYVLLKVPEPQ